MNSAGTLKEQIDSLGPWFHNLRINGIETAPEHFLGDYPSFKWAGFSSAVPKDLTGKTVLDIGCNAGFYSLEMKRRGADRVLGIDADPHYLAQAEFAAKHAGLDIEFQRKSVYELADIRERFDFVIFMGVFYHLRYPLLALDLIFEHVADDLLLFQSMQRGSDHIAEVEEDYAFSEWAIFNDPHFPQLAFIERRYAGDHTNWFIPNKAAMEAMLRSSGFTIEANPDREVYLCRKGMRPYGVEPPPL